MDVLRSATHSWVQYRSEETEKDVLQDMEAADSRAPHAGKHVRTVSDVTSTRPVCLLGESFMTLIITKTILLQEWWRVFGLTAGSSVLWTFI